MQWRHIAVAFTPIATRDMHFTWRKRAFHLCDDIDFLCTDTMTAHSFRFAAAATFPRIDWLLHFVVFWTIFEFGKYDVPRSIFSEIYLFFFFALSLSLYHFLFLHLEYSSGHKGVQVKCHFIAGGYLSLLQKYHQFNSKWIQAFLIFHLDE